MMYIGSLMVALAVEESGLHRRIALRALSLAVRNLHNFLRIMDPTVKERKWVDDGSGSKQTWVCRGVGFIIIALGLALDKKIQRCYSSPSST